MRQPHPHRSREFDFREFNSAFGGAPFGPPRRRGRRSGRGGDVRAAALRLLEEGSRHGYQLIQDINERSNGLWRPSPGSIYPVLQQLEDEGLITLDKVDGRNTASLTDAGREHVEENRESLGQPWDDASGGIDPADMRHVGLTMKQFFEAFKQVMQHGTPEQRAQVVTIVDDARRRMYGLLAEEPVQSSSGDSST